LTSSEVEVLASVGMDVTILVTGATGRVGGQVAAQLAGTGARVRALARNPAGLAGGVVGDLTRPETLGPALTGVAAAFLVFPSVAGDAAAATLVDALTAAVPHVVYLSAYGVPDEPDPRAPADGTILGSHAHVEGLLAAAQGRATFLRASGFAANTLGWASQIRAGDVLRWFHPDARRSLVHEADLAAVAVRCLLGDVPAGGRHHLTGPEQLSQVEQLAAIGAALGRSLRFEALTPDEAVRELGAEFPPGLVEAIVAGQGAFVEAPEPMTHEVKELTGRPARTFAQWARDHAADFR
jgi:uncharacterized protein YbjT (DUF2867 family)